MKKYLNSKVVLLMAFLFLIGVTPSWAEVFSQCYTDADGIDTDGDGIVNNDTVCKHLAAGDGFVMMADGYPLYMFGFSDVTGMPDDQVMESAMFKAEFPAPTITVKEGQKLYLSLTNVGMAHRPDLFDSHTVHWHGFPQASSFFDGEPMASFGINMGFTLTYFYNVAEPGTFMYHCHMEATEHMQMGMLGNLYVTPKQDGTSISYGGKTYTKFAYNDCSTVGDTMCGSTGYDVAYPIQIHAFDPDFHDASRNVGVLNFAGLYDQYGMLNGRGYPDTINTGNILNENGDPSQKVNSLVTATLGQKILLRISNLSFDHYTLTALGIPMKVVGKDAKLLRGPTGIDLSYTTNSVELGGGETADVILNTTGLATGTYFLYTTNLNYLSNKNQERGGMMTEIILN